MKKMLIAIDYDETYTCDPQGWKMFMIMMRNRGHDFICVTARNGYGEMADEVLNAFKNEHGESFLTVVFAGFELKRAATEKLGYKVDVWIDDCPMMIDRQVFLLDER